MPLGAGGPSRVVLDIVLPRGMLSPGSGEGCCLLDLRECSDTGEEGATWADGCSLGEAPGDKVNGWDVGTCPINKWYEATSAPLSSTGLACRAA